MITRAELRTGNNGCPNLQNAVPRRIRGESLIGVAVGNAAILHREDPNVDFTGSKDPKTFIYWAAGLRPKVLQTTDDGLKSGQDIPYGSTVELQVSECRAYEYSQVGFLSSHSPVYEASLIQLRPVVSRRRKWERGTSGQSRRSAPVRC
jgi:hypothetical protein